MIRAQKNLKGLSIVFCRLLSIHAMLHDDVPSTTDQCGARSGSPQKLNNCTEVLVITCMRTVLTAPMLKRQDMFFRQPWFVRVHV